MIPSLMKLLKMGCAVTFPRGEKLEGVPDSESITLTYYEKPRVFRLDKDGLEKALFDVKVFELRGTVKFSDLPLIK